MPFNVTVPDVVVMLEFAPSKRPILVVEVTVASSPRKVTEPAPDEIEPRNQIPASPVAEVPFAQEVVLSVPPESDTAPPLVAMAVVAFTLMPPPREVAASVSDQRVTDPPLVVKLLLVMMSVAARMVSALPAPVTVWFPLTVTLPAVEVKFAAPVVLQAFGRVRLRAVEMVTEPPAESVVRLLKMSPLVELFDVIEIEPVPVVVTLLLAVAK
jgi:hypothetical protein